MTSKTNKPTTAAEAVPQIVELLGGLGGDEQQRAMSAAMILLGHTALDAKGGRAAMPPGEGSTEGISDKAAAWMRKYAITDGQLNHVYSISPDEIDVIAASMPGKSKRQQTLEAYVLCGLRAFIRSGDGRFDDKEGRGLCQKLGCYDAANHYNYIKAFGNLLSGSREGGWKMTNPGFERAAQIVKQLTETTAA